MAGTLYLVATPIGNLEDITFRAVRILGEVDLIACEDTRQTRKLLEHLGIRKPLISYHEHNEAARTPELVNKLEHGADIALVSDAGTPLVSDPGYLLVKAAVENGIPVEPVPGASAVLTALAASGLPTDSFHFAGFLPPRGSRRRQALDQIREMKTTVIVYEAPHRILKTLDDLRETLGDRPIVAAREMTKRHEEFLRGTAASIRDALAGRGPVKGEFTVLIGKPGTSAPQTPDAGTIRATVESRLRDGVARMEAIKSAARDLGISKRAVYQVLHEEAGAGRQR